MNISSVEITYTVIEAASVVYIMVQNGDMSDCVYSDISIYHKTYQTVGLKFIHHQKQWIIQNGCTTVYFTHKWSVVLIYLYYFLLYILSNPIHTLYETAGGKYINLRKFYIRVYFNGAKCYDFIQKFIGYSIYTNEEDTTHDY